MESSRTTRRSCGKYWVPSRAEIRSGGAVGGVGPAGGGADEERIAFVMEAFKGFVDVDRAAGDSCDASDGLPGTISGKTRQKSNGDAA